MAIHRARKFVFPIAFVLTALAGIAIAYNYYYSQWHSGAALSSAAVQSEVFHHFEKYPSVSPVVVGTAAASPAYASSEGPSAAAATSAGNDGNSYLSLPDLFDKTHSSVVQVTTGADAGRLGSGFVFDESGHIITNYHVISSGGPYDVTFSDGTIYRARLVGSDPYSDLAVLAVSLDDVPEGKLVPLVLADSDKIRVGEQVVAIGNPFGLSGTMTTGIVSGLGRLIPAQSPSSPSQQGGNSNNVFSIPNVIQTDAAINPGNSGGPLINMEGKVIGVNSAIYTGTGYFVGVGFALPSNMVDKVVSSIIETGSFRHPWLGVTGTNITPGIATSLGLQEPRGFLVIDVVPGSPAEEAGIHGGSNRVTIDGRSVVLGGDVIIGIDDKVVRKIDDILVYLSSEKNVGDDVELVVIRDGRVQEIEATLGARPGSFESP
ncbi:MAG TPA: trypsin-like peptidase domain-containing protein [Nitrososphaera sp.]|nr:trypsin-like peptidase domain-containing protein [Nitrososphaera sp.]